MPNMKPDASLDNGGAQEHGHSANGWIGLTPDGALLKLANDAEKGDLEFLFGKFLVKVRPPTEDQMDTSRIYLRPDGHALYQSLKGSLMEGMSSQVVYTIGQSGAGKTTSTMKLLEQIMAQFPKVYLCIENMLSVLQLFTNASTEANEDSTRCIFVIDLSFHGVEVCGVTISIKALEIGRVIQNIDTFHVFKDLKDVSFNPVFGTLSTLLENDQIHRLLDCLSALARLKTIEVDYEDNDTGAAHFFDQLEPIAHLLKCPLDQIHELLTAVRTSRGEVLPVGSTKRQEKKDGLLAQLYFRIFTGVLSKANGVLAACFDLDVKVTGTISLIDNPGAENFEENGFDQFIINWVNEFAQHQTAIIVADDKRAQGSVDPKSTHASGNTTLSISENLSRHIQDFTKLPGNDLEKWRGRLVCVEGIDEGSDASDSIGVTHYSGVKSYRLSGFKKANSTAVSEEISSFISRITNFICHPSSTTSRGRDIVSATRTVLQEVQSLLRAADCRWIVCCIRDASDHKELACVDFAKHLDMMFPKFPYSMNLECFRERFLQGEQEVLEISAFSAKIGLTEDHFYLTDSHIYMSSKLYHKLSIANDDDPEASFSEDQHFDFSPGDQADLETSEEIVQRLEHEKFKLERELAQKKEELMTMGMEAEKLRAELGRVSESLSEHIATADTLLIEKARLESNLSRQTAVNNDLVREHARLSTQHELEIKRISEDLSAQTAAAQSLSNEKARVETEYRVKLDQVTEALSKQSAAAKTVLKEKAQLESRHELAMDQTKAKIAELVSDHHVKLNTSAEKLGSEITRHQATSQTLDETSAMLLSSIRSHALDKFFWVQEDGDASAFTKRAAIKITKHLAPLHGQKGVFHAVKQGVLGRARSALPASTILPLVHTLEHLLGNAQSVQNGLSVEQWAEIRDLAIEAFQVKFVDDVTHSLQARALTIQASTIAKGIREMVPPLIGMLDIQKVLRGPVGIVLSRAMKVDTEEYPMLNKGVLVQRIQDIVKVYKTVDLAWLNECVQ